MTSNHKFILLAEDDPVVAELVMHGLATNEPPPKVVHVRDGVEALDFLYMREEFAHRDPGSPAVVLLDIKMPRIDGLEVLRQIKSDERLRCIPVIMLTSSQDERDVRASYEFGANAYIVKPVEFRRLVAVLHGLETFWLQINQPPPDLRTGSVPAEGATDDLASHRHDCKN